jgi:hypothetical protein
MHPGIKVEHRVHPQRMPLQLLGQSGLVISKITPATDYLFVAFMFSV